MNCSSYYHWHPQVLIIYTHTDESWNDELGVGTGGGCPP